MQDQNIELENLLNQITESLNTLQDAIEKKDSQDEQQQTLKLRISELETALSETINTLNQYIKSIDNIIQKQKS